MKVAQHWHYLTDMPHVVYNLSTSLFTRHKQLRDFSLFAISIMLNVKSGFTIFPQLNSFRPAYRISSHQPNSEVTHPHNKRLSYLQAFGCSRF